MGKLQGKVAIVTGGARGIGGATAKIFVDEGATVVIADVLDADGEKTAKELGAAASFRHLDVTDEAAWKKLVAETVERLGRVDVLVNTAAIVLFKELLAIELAEFKRVLDINLTGTFLGLQSVAPVMIKQKKGSIINFSSVDGLRGTNSLGAYAASKWGVRGLTKVAAMEFGHHGVRVNSVHPGGVNTAMGNLGNQTEEELNRSYTRQPIQRISRPSEIGQVVAFLASDESSYMCGAELVVDGGMTIGNYYDMLPGGPAST